MKSVFLVERSGYDWSDIVVVHSTYEGAIKSVKEIMSEDSYIHCEVSAYVEGMWCGGGGNTIKILEKDVQEF